jgi:hypothetical protein
VAGGVLHHVGRERKLKRKCVWRKRRQGGGCSGLRSLWRGSRRQRRPDNGGGALGQRHGTQTTMWSASDMGDGSVGMGAREARRGRCRQRGSVFGHGPVGNGRSERLLTRTRAPGHRRPRQPSRARRGATLPLTAGPHMSVFFRIKNYSRTKIAQNK